MHTSNVFFLMHVYKSYLNALIELRPNPALSEKPGLKEEIRMVTGLMHNLWTEFQEKIVQQFYYHIFCFLQHLQDFLKECLY